jgi:class 3 adenylate cyclase
MSELIERLDGEDRASIDSAHDLAVLWWQNQPNGIPENLRLRVETAAILCNQPIPTDARIGIANTIRSFLHQIKGVDLDHKRIEMHLREFVSGELNLFDVFQFELGELASQKLTGNPEVLNTIHALNQTIYHQVKGTLDGDFRADAASALDKAIDRTKKVKLKNPIESVLKKIEEILSIISKFRNVRLLHFNPDPDKDDLLAFNYPMSKRSSSIKKNPYADVKKWDSYKDERGELEVEFIQIPADNGGCKLVYKLSFGQEEFGYIEYEFDDHGVHKLVKSKCSSVSEMMDTFLNDRLQEDIKKLIDTKKRESQKGRKPHHWTEVFKELSEYLSRIIQRPFLITCDRKPGLNESPLVIEVNGEESVIFKHVNESSIKGESFEINYESEEGVVQVGKIIFDPLDENRESVIKEAVSFFEGIVQWRESRREAHMGHVGLLVADLKSDDNLEEKPTKHDFGVLYADIDDYSTIMTQLAETYPDKQDPLSEIMDEFFTEVRFIIESEFHVVVDKFVGDEIIIEAGPPYNKQGKDAFGNSEPDFVKYIETSYKASLRIQSLLDEISHKVETELQIKLPKPLRFACGAGLLFNAPIGVYGSLDKKGAGADYTSISPQMNLIARVLSNADGDEFLMPLETYEIYIDLGGNKLKMVGEPYEVYAKGAPSNRAIVVKVSEK